MINIDTILIVAAFVNFVAACFGWSKGVPAGLACWVGTLLV